MCLSVYVAMHIQCSDATYQLLCKLGGFELESRGIIEVKVNVILKYAIHEPILYNYIHKPIAIYIVQICITL